LANSHTNAVASPGCELALAENQCEVAYRQKDQFWLILYYVWQKDYIDRQRIDESLEFVAG